MKRTTKGFGMTLILLMLSACQGSHDALHSHSGITGSIRGVIDASMLTERGCHDSSQAYVYTAALSQSDGPVDNNPPVAYGLIPHSARPGQYEFHAAFLAPGEYIVALTCLFTADPENGRTDIRFLSATNVVVDPRAEAQHNFAL